MNLIATRGFLNTNRCKALIKFADGHGPLDDNGDTIEGRHVDGVHKGARLSIGGDKKYADMKNMQQEAALIRDLNSAGVVGDAADTELCAKIDAELKTEAKQRTEYRKLYGAGSTADTTTQVVSILVALGIIPAGTKLAAPATAAPAVKK